MLLKMTHGKQKRVVSEFLYRRTFFIQYQKSGRNTYPMDIPNWKVNIQDKKRSSKFGDALIS
jgi:hypothetical protein